jgi:hypothetical protein
VSLNIWNYPTPNNFNLTFTVTGAVNWRVTVNFADPLFNGFVPTSLSSNGNPLKSPGYSCSALPTFVGQTNLTWASADWKNGYLSGSRPGTGGTFC